MWRSFSLFLMLSVILATFTACQTTETSRALKTTQVESAAVTYNGPKSTMVVGKFDNRSSYMRGLFSDSVDRLGGQAKTILITHLQQSNRFTVMDRDNLKEAEFESSVTGKAQQIKGADYIVTGDVTEFGRKDVGNIACFGIFGRGRTQVAYSKVALNIVNAQTTEVLFSVQGAGEYELSNQEILGFGSTASYDSTLNGKVLDLAVREAVNRLVEGIDKGAWKASK